MVYVAWASDSTPGGPRVDPDPCYGLWIDGKRVAVGVLKKQTECFARSFPA
jgi:hypothetical protein